MNKHIWIHFYSCCYRSKLLGDFHWLTEHLSFHFVLCIYVLLLGSFSLILSLFLSPNFLFFYESLFPRAPHLLFWPEEPFRCGPGLPSLYLQWLVYHMIYYIIYGYHIWFNLCIVTFSNGNWMLSSSHEINLGTLNFSWIWILCSEVDLCPTLN